MEGKEIGTWKYVNEPRLGRQEGPPRANRPTNERRT